MNNLKTNDSNQISLRKRVYDYIKIEMDKGNYSPGSVIRLNELSRQMGISKTPLREAMIRLEAEGLVTIYPRQGVVVNRFDLSDSRYLFSTIGSLEREMVIVSFSKFDEDVIGQMKEHCKAMRIALENDDYVTYDSVHWKYHHVFTDLAKSPFVERIITPIKHRLWDYPKRGFSKTWIEMACDEHEAIVEAIENGDLEKCAFIIREQHWSYEYNEKYIRKVYFPNT